MCFQRTFLHHLRNLLKGICLLQAVTACHRAPQLRQNSAAVQCMPDVRQQRPDIRAFSAGNRQHSRLLCFVKGIQ